MIAFHKAVWPSPDDPVFAVIDSLLTSGRTSRLFRRLVLETRVASDVYSMQVPGDRYPNLFGIGATPRAPHTASEVEAGILQELRRLGDEPIPERELQKIRNQLRASFLYPLRSNQGLAGQLSFYEIITGDWKNLNAYASALQAATGPQVQELSRRTFVASNRTVTVLARPTEGPGPGQAAPDPGTGKPSEAARGVSHRPAAPQGAR